MRVFEGQFKKYPDLPRGPDALDELLNERDPFNVDKAGRLRWVDGEVAINFGKNRGRKLRELAEREPNFLKWMLKGDFPKDTRDIVQNAMIGKYPVAPSLPK